MSLLLTTSGSEAFVRRRLYVPSAPATDPHFDKVTALLHFDGTNNSTTFIDSSSSPMTLVASRDAKLTTTEPKFGSAAALLNGSASNWIYVSATSQPSLGAGDFTVEGWTNLAVLGVYQTLIRFGGSVNIGGWSIRISNTNALQFLAHGVAHIHLRAALSRLGRG